ncbi:MAG: aminoglycoside phosphotransferase family protein [Candidatus Micrarchaeota archaeon]|nr:aminoglycoside phosphotransferase family protein [Candidatus Micrarchaeota archaeon]
MDGVLERKIAVYFKAHHRLLGEGSGISIERVYYLGRGARHKNFVVRTAARKYIVRMSFTTKLAWKRRHLRQEYRSLKVIEPTGVGPKAYIYEPDQKPLGQPFIVIEYVSGKRPNPHNANNEIIDAAAEMIAKIQLLKVGAEARETLVAEPMGRLMLKKLEARKDYLLKDGKFSDRFKSTIETGYEGVLGRDYGRHAKLVFSHGDVAPINIVKTKDGCKLIDLETLALRDPEFDIAHFFYRTNLTDAQKKRFLKRYVLLGGNASVRKHLDDFERARTFERLIWAIVEAFKIREGLRDKEYSSGTDAKYFMRKANEIFNRCKDIGAIPKGAKWDKQLQ